MPPYYQGRKIPSAITNVHILLLSVNRRAKRRDMGVFNYKKRCLCRDSIMCSEISLGTMATLNNIQLGLFFSLQFPRDGGRGREGRERKGINCHGILITITYSTFISLPRNHSVKAWHPDLLVAMHLTTHSSCQRLW